MMKSLAVASLALALAACGSMDNGNMGSSSGDMGANRLSGPAIAGVLATANQGEIDAGQLASTKATSTAVRDFANMMVTEHTSALSTARDVFSRSKLIPDMQNQTVIQLQDLSRRTNASLQQYSGSGFDRTYMQSQVDMHQWLLNQIDSTLMPSARGELRTLLTQQRAAVAMHLDRARTILSSL